MLIFISQILFANKQKTIDVTTFFELFQSVKVECLVAIDNGNVDTAWIRTKLDQEDQNDLLKEK
jgi:hypothetical protein